MTTGITSAYAAANDRTAEAVHTAASRRIRDRLKRYRLLCSEVDWLVGELRRIKEREMDIVQDVTRRIAALPAGKGGHADPTCAAAEQLIERCQQRAKQARQRIQALMQERAAVERMLAALTPQERSIVQLRWIEGRTWVAVGLRAYLCERQCQRISNQAIRKLILVAEEEKDKKP